MSEIGRNFGLATIGSLVIGQMDELRKSGFKSTQLMPDKVVKKLIEDAIADGKTIHGNRRSFQKIRDLGVEVPDGSRRVSWEEVVERFFSDDEKLKALERAGKIPERPDIPLPSVVSIYEEIIKGIILGTNGAAITQSCILVEYMLKFATYKIEMDGFGKHDIFKWTEFERTSFGDAINRAAKQNLLSGERKKSLEEFKNKTRNPYLHYNIKKITEGVVLRNVRRINIETGEERVIDQDSDSEPTVRSDAKRFVDEDRVLEIFTFANDFVTEMWTRISHLE